MSNELVQHQSMNLSDTMELGKAMAASGFFADSRDAAQAVVKILAGRELGFGAVASMTGVNIIKGKVSLSANLIAASIKRSGRYNYRVVQMDDNTCTIAFFEGGEKLGTSTFTMDDAKRAGLGGQNWQKFPRNMLFARAISNGAKWYCPDLSGGPLYTPDELGATVDGETGEVVDAPTPEPAAPKTYGTEETFFQRVQEKTGGYYDDPYHLVLTIGGWPDFTDVDAVKDAGNRAIEHARQAAEDAAEGGAE